VESAVVKTFLASSPQEKTTEKIKTFEGEMILPGTMNKWLSLAYKLRTGK